MYKLDKETAMTDLNLISLNYVGSELRFVGTADKPEWVANDVVGILYPASVKNKNSSTYLNSVPAEWKGSKNLATLGGNQSMTTLYEAGLYKLIASSLSPIAVHFQKWLFEEVLPTIRKTGGYSITPLTDSQAQIGEFTQIDAQIQRSISLAGKPGGHAVAAYKTMFGSMASIRQPKAAAVPLTPAIKASRDETLMARIVEVSRKKGPINARTARQGISGAIKVSAEEIRALFQRLADAGRGQVFGEDKQTTFIAN